jgi:hypothetical protein
VDYIGELLNKSRNAVKSLLQQELFTSEEKTLFRMSKCIPRLMIQCDPENLTSCSHVLKTVLMLAEQQPVLKEWLLQDYRESLTTFFMTFLRCEDDTSVEEALKKFWLVRRLCEDHELRNLVLCAEGGILLLMSAMRSGGGDVGEGLGILSPLCDEPFFQDLSLTTAELINRFVVSFQHEESVEKRRSASDLLLIFAEGLSTSSASSRVISKSFIDSGVLFIFLQILQEENDCHDVEWQMKGTLLLCALMEDARIREVFLGEPLFALHTLVNSFHCHDHRSVAYVSLISVLQVVVCHSSSHQRLFESGVVMDLVDHIKMTLTTSSDVTTEEMKTLHVFECLNIFAVLVSSEHSRSSIQQLELEGFFKLLCHHENHDVRDVANYVLKQMGSQSKVTPDKWRTLFEASV